MPWKPPYATVDQMKSWRGVTDSADDVRFSLAIEAASRAIDQRCGRQFGLVDAAEARDFSAWRDRDVGWFASIDDLMTTAGWALELDTNGDGAYESVATSDLQLWPHNAASELEPWREVRWRAGAGDLPSSHSGGVRITAQWGWSSVPDAITQATILQTSRLLSRPQAPFGIAGSPDAGSELRLLARLDPDVMTVIRPYIRRPTRIA